MATRRYGISRGEVSADQITEAVGAATSSDNMEFTFDLATGMTRDEVILGLEKIIQYILRNNFPPA